MRKPFVLVLVLAAAVSAVSACDDVTGPSFGPVPDEPGEVTLSDFEGSPVRDPSAFDAVSATAVRPDQTQEWDFVFALRDDGTPELRPKAAVVDEGSDAGLQTVDRGFTDVSEAPEQGYVTAAPVVVQEGTVLVGRTRQDPNFVITCPHFFKLEVVSVDDAAGTVTLEHLINPACDRRNLVPGSSNETE